MFMTTHEEGARMDLVLQMGKRRLRAVKGLIWGHSAHESQDGELPNQASISASRPWEVGLDDKEGACPRLLPGCLLSSENNEQGRAKAKMYHVGWSLPAKWPRLVSSAEGKAAEATTSPLPLWRLSAPPAKWAGFQPNCSDDESGAQRESGSHTRSHSK